MRGYMYQVLTSVLAWIGLADNQVLYLEGAEDLDLIQENAATAIQVKDTAGTGNITLRTPGVIAAIAHYWAHRRRNAARSIRFQYLTTSGVGKEQGNPFGQNVSGIELWNRLKAEPDKTRLSSDLTALKSFLVGEPDLPVELHNFLRTAADAEIVDGLIVPIEWVTAAPRSSALLQTIKDRLVEHGATQGVAASDAEDAIGALHLEAWRVATREQSRALNRADFIRIFDQSTRVSLPKALIADLVARIGGVVQLPLAAEISAERVITNPPPLPPRYCRRLGVLESITTATQKNIAVLYGATGTGKTTAAAAHTMQDGRSWAWVDLRGHDSSAIGLRLAAATHHAERSRSALPIVLDDLDTNQDPRLYEGAIKRLATIQHSRSATLIITTAQELPPRLCQALGFDASDVVRMPPFERVEIEAFLAERGCPTGFCTAWASILELTTQGHPQLVHARVAALEVAGFPRPTSNDLIETPRDVLDVRSEARRLLAQLDPAARELIYRLSLSVGILDRDRLIAIGNVSPPIAEPGNAVDRLVGPWIEVVASSSFRVSPLVRSSGQEANGEAWARGMHGMLAQALLARRTLTPSDISAILMHAIAGQDGLALARLSVGLLHADRASWRAIAESASWFAYLAVEPGTDLPSDGPGGLFLIRLMQFRIAAAAGDVDAVQRVTARFDEEFLQASTDASTRIARFLFISQMLMHDEVRIPIEELVRRASQYITLADMLADIIGAVPSEQRDLSRLLGPSGTIDYAGYAALAFFGRIKTKEDLGKMVDGLEAIEAEHARRILLAIGRDESEARLLLDPIWLTEHNSDVRGWEDLRLAIRRVYDAARRHNIVGLARAAAKIIVRMTDEDLDDPTSALTLADEFAAELAEFPSLLDARARILSRRGEEQAALVLWRRALPEWQTGEYDFAPSYAYRDAALAAARLNDWSEAAQFLADGARRATASEQAAFRAGLLVDAGYAHWKSSNNAAALAKFCEGIAVLDAMQDESAIEPVRSVQKRAGHTLMWVATSTAGRSAAGYSAPPPACCSSLEPMPEAPVLVTPIDFIIRYLVDFEHAAGTGSDLFRKFDDRLRNSPFGAVRATHADSKVRQILATVELDGLVAAAVDWVESLVLVKSHLDHGREAIERILEDTRVQLDESHYEVIRTFLLFGVYAGVARGNASAMPIARWRLDAQERGVEAPLTAILATVESLFVADSGNAWSIFCSPPSSHWACQHIAALRLSIANDTDPRQMLQCHGLMISQLLSIPNRKVVAEDLAQLISGSWSRLCERPFLLRNPRISVPAIKEAIGVGVGGWSKVRMALQAALQAVALPSDNAARRTIETMPDA